MSYTVISDVSETLIELLKDNLTPEPISNKENIVVCSPAEKGDSQLSLYLYNIAENGFNREVNMIPMEDGNLRFPPKSFYLHYLLTAYSTSELSSKVLDEHKILGKAIQVILDNPILRGNMLKGSLNGSDTEVKIEVKNLTYDEMMRVWHFSDVPYRLSVAYTVGPIYMDSNRVKIVKRVKRSEININRKNGVR